MCQLDYFKRSNVLPLYIQDIKKDIDYSDIIPKYLLIFSFILCFIFQILAIIVFQKSYIYIVFISVNYIVMFKICNNSFRLNIFDYKKK
jgi:hypothetical protein